MRFSEKLADLVEANNGLAQGRRRLFAGPCQTDMRTDDAYGELIEKSGGEKAAIAAIALALRGLFSGWPILPCSL